MMLLQNWKKSLSAIGSVSNYFSIIGTVLYQNAVILLTSIVAAAGMGMFVLSRIMVDPKAMLYSVMGSLLVCYVATSVIIWRESPHKGIPYWHYGLRTTVWVFVGYVVQALATFAYGFIVNGLYNLWALTQGGALVPLFSIHIKVGGLAAIFPTVFFFTVKEVGVLFWACGRKHPLRAVWDGVRFVFAEYPALILLNILPILSGYLLGWFLTGERGGMQLVPFLTKAMVMGLSILPVIAHVLQMGFLAHWYKKRIK